MQWLDGLGKIIIVLVPAVVGAVVGYYLKYYLDKKAQFITKNAEVKREMYQKFVDLMISFFEAAKKNKQKNSTGEIYKFYKQYILYGSPSVVKSYAELMQLLYKSENSELDAKIALLKMTAVFGAMRKDIGLSNYGLGEDSRVLMRGIIKDYDELIAGTGRDGR